MNCSEIVTLAPLYLSGELEEPRASEFARHLEACPSCAREMQQQADFDARVRKSMSEEVDSGALENRVRGRIAAETQGQRRRWLGVAAAVAVGVLGFRVLMDARVPRICADAAEDHRDEVISQQHRNWIADPAAVSTLARRVGIETLDTQSLAPAGYHFEHGKLCRLNGLVFVHLVFLNDTREISIFLGPRDADAQKAGRREAAISGEHVASIQTGRVTTVAVTMESGDAALRIAQSAAHSL